MSLRRAALALSGLLVVVWMAAGALLCENALRVPKRHVPMLEPVRITAADNVSLAARFLQTKSSAKCVIVLHGIADTHASAIGFAPPFLDAGYSVLAPDSRAHGGSGGQLVTYGVLEADDVLRWVAWLQRHGCREIFGLGESLGAAILIQAASRQPVFAAIAAECSFQDLRSVAEWRIAQVAGTPAAKALLPPAFLYARVRYGIDLNGASPLRSVRLLRTPLLLIHGLADTNTPPSHSEAIRKANPSVQAWFVPRAGHTGASAAEPELFWRRLLGWFESSLPAQHP